MSAAARKRIAAAQRARWAKWKDNELNKRTTMCGRYRLTAKERYLRDHFGLDEDPAWAPRWNIAPTQLVPIIRQDAKLSRRSFDLVRWGLIPSWAKDRSIAAKTINAMSETAAESPAFREALRLRRCLIPADSFYEWKPTGAKQKQPFSIGMADESVFSFTGLWARWIDSGGEAVETCTILTTSPNAVVADVHNRMPVILKRKTMSFGWILVSGILRCLPTASSPSTPD
jgi:putative SOS response-associated peptidase YedK